jgi:hypothetical protein
MYAHTPFRASCLVPVWTPPACVRFEGFDGIRLDRIEEIGYARLDTAHGEMGLEHQDYERNDQDRGNLTLDQRVSSAAYFNVLT